MGDILFLAHRVPYPPDRGDKMRSFHILKALSRIAPVHLAAFADDDADIAHAAALQPYLASRHVERRTVSRAKAGVRGIVGGQPLSLPLYDSAAMRSWIDVTRRASQISAIFAFSGQMAQFVPTDLGRTRFVMDFVDVDSAKFTAFAQSAAGPMSWVYAREGKRLAAFEAAVAARADCSLFVSDAEAALFRRRAGAGIGPVRTLENGIDLDRYDPAGNFARIDAGPSPLIVFTGQMDYRPNIDAVVAFATGTLPLIRARRRDARFAIVGRRPDPAVERLANLPGVVVTGEVDDVRGWIAAADVVVAPLMLARGIQNKVLEAMALAKAVVASPAAAEGIDARPGEALVVADGAAAQAEAVVTLLDDRALTREIGHAARARMIERYGWDARLAALPALVGMTADAHAA